MGSEHPRSPRARFRFGFTGKVKESQEDSVSVDDILESLGRGVELSDRLREDARVVLDNEEAGGHVSAGLPGSVLGRARKVVVGKFAFVIVLLGGVFTLWTYGTLRSVTDPSTLDGLIQSPAYPAVFTDPMRLIAVALVCFLPVLLLRRKHIAKNRLLYG